MTVSSTTARKTFTGDGATTSFATSPMVFFAAADLTVYVVTTATGAATTLVLNTHYTVSGGSGSTGTVNLAGGSSPYGAPSAAQTVVIVRELDRVQEVDFVDNEATDAEVQEDALDKLTMMIQEIDARVARAITLADSDVSSATATLPTPEASSLIGWNSAGTALQNYAEGDIDPDVLVSTFMETVLDDTTAAAARTTLDAAQKVSSTTEETSPDLIADFVGLVDTSAGTEDKVRLAYLLGLGAPPGQGVLLNGKVVMSVATNALTIAIKGNDGNDPSATNPVFVAFRSATAATAGFTVRTMTAAASVVVPDTATLGHASASACHLFAYLIDNSGTVEVAVSNLPPDYPGTFANTRLISTTTIGTGADSATGIYSTTGRSNVPWVCVAMAKSTQTTAGTWAAAMTQVDQAPFRIPTCAFSAYNNATQNIAYNTQTKCTLNTEDYDPDSTFDAATNSRHQPNVAGVYRYAAQASISGALDGAVFNCSIYKNGAATNFITVANQGLANAASNNVVQEVLMNGTSDYIEVYEYQADSGATTRASTADRNRLCGSRVSGGV